MKQAWYSIDNTLYGKFTTGSIVRSTNVYYRWAIVFSSSRFDESNCFLFSHLLACQGYINESIYIKYLAQLSSKLSFITYYKVIFSYCSYLCYTYIIKRKDLFVCFNWIGFVLDEFEKFVPEEGKLSAGKYYLTPYKNIKLLM